ncbi:helix-turn-helix domain-containing protein [Streptomyces sp. BE147]|uniref:ArsR/SmtB family transcription factor n=1 Tax=unclassified Streptomyces TaxID=2593676 RepID=UPI002E772B4C|nr:helix-turn-helix domain-containing protein [Streptomyces sp. BE147]MEE1740455.1 helix-turn-helix domain-containing protein [Streptomyces sp. BE147]
MSWWQVSADTLATSRFVTSPLAETTACLKILHRGAAAHAGERDWLDAHLPRYRERLARDATTASLVRAALGRSWNATFLTPTPADTGDRAFAEELEQVRRTPAATARADLRESLSGPLPAPLDRSDDLAERAADLLAWVWTETVLPSWPVRKHIIEADVVARTARLGQGGWATALAGMRPGMRWLGQNRLQITTCDSPSLEVSGAQLMFVPVTPSQSWVCWNAPGVAEDRTVRRCAVVYPCAGALAGTGRAPVPESLGALLGTGRAAVLVLLDTPKSTTQLVALTGQGLGSVGRHLKVLLEARLIQRRRAGRSVLYFRSATGTNLVDAQSD